ncbi:hypothetical protein M758_3G049700 [Ceratodon purpureus]|nr:hypothetical protein M758_3G049700 [Ceratodon purpureus]
MAVVDTCCWFFSGRVVEVTKFFERGQILDKSHHPRTPDVRLRIFKLSPCFVPNGAEVHNHNNSSCAVLILLTLRNHEYSKQFHFYNIFSYFRKVPVSAKFRLVFGAGCLFLELGRCPYPIRLRSCTPAASLTNSTRLT